MAHVHDRWLRPAKHPDTGDPILTKTGKPVFEKTTLYGKGLRYRVRYFNPAGDERSKSFADKQKKLAEDFLIEIESSKREGKYVDPRAGRTLFEVVAARWKNAQTCDYTSLELMERDLRNHVQPVFAGHSVGAIKPSHVQTWLRELQDAGVSASCRVRYFAYFVSIMEFAKDEKMIIFNPAYAKSVKRPVRDRGQVKVWPIERSRAVRAALPERYRPLVDLPVGLGLRQGEVLGFSLEDVERDRGVAVIGRQIRMVSGQLVFALPKGGKTREIPIAATLLAKLDRYAEQFPSVAVTLPWRHPGGPPVTVTLLLVTRAGKAVNRNVCRNRVWVPAVKKAGVTKPGQADGMHALRHLFASILLDAGESIKALASYLGHSDPGFTLRVYTHLLPGSHQRTRSALDGYFTPSPIEVTGADKQEHPPSDGRTPARPVHGLHPKNHRKSPVQTGYTTKRGTFSIASLPSDARWSPHVSLESRVPQFPSSEVPEGHHDGV
ncbi:tyrosine-type recombinase/integrase [Amycolatopsis sp. H20-H5]|uniref:tyrosine-type recombinase/integrase n=1 Tax=Amycolatopsis sp. H20-H5 TaxID=3046309 RepID=UPI002DBBD549|nr:site-specific integrase [Amycolatopsis sp. H20-H5]MEC3974849.1 site-specific integrase [Amycolatopsis sp. H20-H5]